MINQVKAWNQATLFAKQCLAILQPTVRLWKATTVRRLCILHHSSKVQCYQKIILGVCASIPYKERHVIWKINWNINFIGRFPHLPPAPTPYIQIHPLWVSHEHPMSYSWSPYNTIWLNCNGLLSYQDSFFYTENVLCITNWLGNSSLIQV